MNVRRLILMTAVLAVVSPVFAQFTGDGFKNSVVGSKHDLGANTDLGLTGTTTAVLKLTGVAAKLLSQSNGRGILQVRSCDFKDVVKGGTLLCEH